MMFKKLLPYIIASALIVTSAIVVMPKPMAEEGEGSIEEIESVAEFASEGEAEAPITEENAETEVVTEVETSAEELNAEASTETSETKETKENTPSEEMTDENSSVDDTALEGMSDLTVPENEEDYVSAMQALMNYLPMLYAEGSLGENAAIEDVDEKTVKGSCGAGSFVIDLEKGTLTISGSGKISAGAWSTYADKVTSASIGDGITGVASNTFAGLYNLRSITFAAPATVKFDAGAFNGVSASINLPSEDYGNNEGEENLKWEDIIGSGDNLGEDLDGKNPLSGTVTVTGSAKYGATITAKLTDLQFADGGVVYQWYADGKPISGATGTLASVENDTELTYVIQPIDIGKVITLKVHVPSDSEAAYGSIFGALGAAVEKQDGPAAPSVNGKAPEAEGGKGSITGLTASKNYEYSTTADFREGSTYAVVAGSTVIDNLEPGIYYVREIGTDITNPGAHIAVEIPGYNEEVTTPVPVTDIMITWPGDVIIKVGNQVTLDVDVLPDNATDKSVTWSSANEKIASIDSQGRLTGIGVGSTTITALAKDGSGIRDSILVTVKEDIEDEDPDDNPVINFSTTDTNLVEKIAGTADNQKITINYSANAVIQKAVFDAIKNTNKEIKMTSNGSVEWIFRGVDITNTTKDIRLNTDVETLRDTTKDSRTGIASILGSRPALVVTFEDNGNLPGRARVRIPVSNAHQAYLNGTRYNAYYYDESVPRLVPVAAGLTVTADGYVEFNITHNSTYVVVPETSTNNNSNNSNNNNSNNNGSIGTGISSGSSSVGSGVSGHKITATKYSSGNRVASRPVSPKTGEK